MNVHLYATPEGFGPVARWVYRRDPVLFTAELTTLRTSTWPADRLLLSTSNCDGAMGAALQMRNAVMLVSGLPPTLAKDAVAALAPALTDLPGVRGTPSTAAAFGQAWAEATGTSATASFEETLYRLDDLNAPENAFGEPRLATDADEELLVEWFDAFFVEAFGAASDRATSRSVLLESAAHGRIVLWTVDGMPVAMARVHGGLLGMSRIGPVFTPPGERGHGYGAAVTAEAVRYALRDGSRDVVLFADVANEVSNRIYRRLGFVPVAENVQYAFTA